MRSLFTSRACGDNVSRHAAYRADYSFARQLDPAAQEMHTEGLATYFLPRSLIENVCSSVGCSAFILSRPIKMYMILGQGFESPFLVESMRLLEAVVRLARFGALNQKRVLPPFTQPPSPPPPPPLNPLAKMYTTFRVARLLCWAPF